MSLLGFPVDATGMARGEWTVEDASQYIADLAKGMCCVQGICERGPIGKAIKVASEDHYYRVFGREISASTFPLLVKRALRHAPQWVARLAHYTDAGDAGTLTAVSATSTAQDRTDTEAHPARIVGKSITTVDMSTNKNIKLQVNSETPVTVDCSAGASDPAAVTLAEIVSAINTAMSATIAKAESGKLVLESATTGADQSLTLSEPDTLDITDQLFTQTIPYTATGTDAGTPQDSIKLVAYEGAWADTQIRWKIEQNTLYEQYFDVHIDHLLDPDLYEVIRECTLDETDEAHFIENRVPAGSYFIKSCQDMESSNAEPLPAFGTWFTFSGGADGLTGIGETDYIGDKTAQTGLYVFDEVTEAVPVWAPECLTPAYLQAAIGYAEDRGDMVAFSETPFYLKPQDAKDYRLGEGAYTHPPFNSRHGAMYFGKPTILDTTGVKRSVSAFAHFAHVYARSQQKGEWTPPAGMDYPLRDILGLDFNVGSPANQGLGDLLVDNQINPLVIWDRDGPAIWEEKTLQVMPSAFQDLHAMFLFILMRKSILPWTRYYAHQPNHPDTWRRFDQLLRPFYDRLFREGAILGYRLITDRDAYWTRDGELKNATLNTPDEVQQGIYKCLILVKTTPTLRYLGIRAVNVGLSTRFEELLGKEAEKYVS